VRAVFTGLVLAIVAPLIGTPIAVWIYGGLTGGSTDFIVSWLLASGQTIFTAAFLPRIAGNLVDKVVSCVIAYMLISKLPMQIKNRFESTNNKVA
jgi:energy-coupling factor transport system substrate-specific component